jgi:DNA-binding response OmpR family regulator
MAKAILITEEDETSAVAVLDVLNTAHGNNSLETVSTSHSVIMLRQEHPMIARGERLALPEILLLSLKMPRAEGFLVMDWVRAQSHLKNTWVVVVSGNEEIKEVQLGYGLGALLIKPCSDQEIQKMMQWFADSRQSGANGAAALALR